MPEPLTGIDLFCGCGGFREPYRQFLAYVAFFPASGFACRAA
jgi:site-specific DNA-cytosine methylase